MGSFTSPAVLPGRSSCERCKDAKEVPVRVASSFPRTNRRDDLCGQKLTLGENCDTSCMSRQAYAIMKIGARRADRIVSAKDLVGGLARRVAKGDAQQRVAKQVGQRFLVLDRPRYARRRMGLRPQRAVWLGRKGERACKAASGPSLRKMIGRDRRIQQTEMAAKIHSR